MATIINQKRRIGLKLKIIIIAVVVLVLAAFAAYQKRYFLYSYFTSPRIDKKGGDLTIINARIWTGDPDDPWKGEMTIRNGKIVAMNTRNPSGKTIDAKGRLIVPGFWDGHVHPQTPYVLTSPEAPMLFKAESVKDVQEILKKYVNEHPEDKYPRMFGWMDAIFKEGEKPNRKQIDIIVSDRPVYLVHHGGHVHWANTKALEIAGILEKSSKELPGTGYVERDLETGLATGYLEETELGSTHGILLSTVKKIKPLTFDQEVIIQRKILEMYPKVGVTTIWTKDGDIDITRIYEEILRQDALSVRAILDNLYTYFSRKDDLKLFAQRAKEIEDSNLPKGFLRADGVKIMVDLPYHSWMFEPYEDDKSDYGRPTFDIAELKRQINEADRLGLQINLLTMGDRAVHEALNILEETAKNNPPRKRRHTVEHAEFIIDKDIPRFKEMDVMVVMNPIGSYPDMEYQKSQDKHKGVERRNKTFHRWKELSMAGATVVQGSDFPLAPMDPLIGIHILVNGTDIHGNPKGGLWPHKNITIQEALRMYTVNPAYAAFWEDRNGMLKEGYDADFVVLSENILDPSFDKKNVAKVKAVMTIFNGHVLYEDYSSKEKVLEFGEKAIE